MAAKGFYLVQGDRTTCGGRITTGAEDHTLFDKPVAREQDSVTCGKHAGLYKIAGGIDNDTIHGVFQVSFAILEAPVAPNEARMKVYMPL